MAIGVLFFNAVPLGVAGNGITITISSVEPANNPLSLTVVGTTITVHPATDGGASVNSTTEDVANLINATAAAAALVVATVTLSGTTPTGSVTLLGGGNSTTGPKALVQLYDVNRRAVQDQLCLDLFVNDKSYYGAGGIVPPLLYPQSSQIEVDAQLISPNPLTISVFLIGRQRIPC